MTRALKDRVDVTKADITDDSGFSVLEALVAMAVLAAAMLPILALQSQFVRSVAVMERTETRLSVEAAVRAHIRSVNLTERPRGDMNMAGATLRWTASPALPERRVRAQGGVRSRYVTTLYNVEIVVNYNSGASEKLIMTGLGWTPTSSYLANL